MKIVRMGYSRHPWRLITSDGMEVTTTLRECLVGRLRLHIAQMSPHQRDRQHALLLIEALAALCGLGAWVPIETAPRDSKARLVWVPENRCIYCVSWTDGNCGPGEDGDPPGWVIFGGGYRAYLRDGRVTHWMPLPAPPQAPNTNQEATK